MAISGRGVRRVLTLLGIVAFLAFAWVSFTVYWLWQHQERVVFQPPTVLPAETEAPIHGMRVAFSAADGHSIFGYYVAPRTRDVADTAGDDSSRNRPLVLAFHGNADLAVWLVPWAREIAARRRLPAIGCCSWMRILFRARSCLAQWRKRFNQANASQVEVR